ncbi:MAG: 3-isopropylmalate dehydratase [Phycisphaerae bacterium]
METKISGKAYVVGDNIDTDQIIPAEYLSYNPANEEERKYFGMYSMSGVPLEESGLPQGNVRFVDEGKFETDFAVIIGGRNFGCGSSREHAPLSIAEAGCRLVIAESYARIFYRNSINGGYLVPITSKERLIESVKTGDEVEVDLENHTFKNVTRGTESKLIPMGDVAEIVEAGGVFEYARHKGML